MESRGCRLDMCKYVNMKSESCWGLPVGCMQAVDHGILELPTGYVHVRKHEVLDPPVRCMQTGRHERVALLGAAGGVYMQAGCIPESNHGVLELLVGYTKAREREVLELPVELNSWKLLDEHVQVGGRGPWSCWINICK